MELIPIKSSVIKRGGFLYALDKILKKNHLKNGDVLVIASKVIAADQDDIVKIEKVKPLSKAKVLAKKYQMDSRFVQVVIEQSDKIIGGVKGTLLTSQDNMVIANAGADRSNAPKGYFILWPKNPVKAADNIHKYILQNYNRKLGIIISDSHCQPRRLGTTGFALAIAGFTGVTDQRNKKDLAGQPLKITFINVADDLAASANLLMGEAGEKIPFVLIKNSPIILSNQSAVELTKNLKIKRTACLFYRSNL